MSEFISDTICNALAVRDLNPKSVSRPPTNPPSILRSSYIPFDTASATFMPSTALDTIPPEYPAPSPAGYSPFTFTLWKSSPRNILTGEELLVSTPVSTASAIAKPLSFLSNGPTASRNDCAT
jgi:hypothetical protein